jgi:hypothetical protein
MAVQFLVNEITANRKSNRFNGRNEIKHDTLQLIISLRFLFCTVLETVGIFRINSDTENLEEAASIIDEEGV